MWLFFLLLQKINGDKIMKQNLLLLSDVEGLGRTGEIVSVKPGYARNFLVPQKKAVIAQKHTLRMQERLKKERAKQAVVDKKDAQELSKRLENMRFTTEVKVDPEGHLYGSVSTSDVADLLQKEGYEVDKKSIKLQKVIKQIGTYPISLVLKEGVLASIHLEVVPEPGTFIKPVKKAKEEAKEQEEEKKEDLQEAEKNAEDAKEE